MSDIPKFPMEFDACGIFEVEYMSEDDTPPPSPEDHLNDIFPFNRIAIPHYE